MLACVCKAQEDLDKAPEARAREKERERERAIRKLAFEPADDQLGL